MYDKREILSLISFRYVYSYFKCYVLKLMSSVVEIKIGVKLQIV